MKRNLFICVFIFSVFLGCLREEQGINRPNILFIIADDQRADALGCAGNSYIKTPNIDKLAENGVRFSNNYIMGGHHGAICAPSRAMLMSGRSLYHVNDKLDGVISMTAHFSEYGYETFGTGKWHNGAASFEASFQEGENVFLGGMCDHYNVPCRTMQNGKLSEPIIKGYSTDVFTLAAKQYLECYSGGSMEKPFFCYVAYTAPHDPRSPREDYIGMYKDESIPVPGNFKKLHPFVFDNMQIRDERLAPWPRTPEIIQSSIADYYALISHLDEKIGEIIETLKKNGLYENTIIVYTADNGLAIGSHGLLGKQNLYECSTKVPLIISGPGISDGRVLHAFTYLYDLFPTLCNLSGIPLPKNVDGTDLSPVIHGEVKNVRESLFTVYRNTVRAVRDLEWKLIRYPERNYNQLFNLKNDPLEIYNLAAESEYKGKVDSMLNLIKVWQLKTGDTVSLTAGKILPMDYEYKELIQKPDVHQPEYILTKYFRNTESHFP